MPLNLQERHQSISIPAGWLPPEFTFGQTVVWEVSLGSHWKARKAWGQIIEMGFYSDGWQYGVIPASDCPIALAYPETWGKEELTEILRPEQLTLADW
jgi:hypothetical protein